MIGSDVITSGRQALAAGCRTGHAAAVMHIQTAQ
jgi:hypothetical protein